MKRYSWGKIGGIVTIVLLAFASAALAAVGDPCLPPVTGCYCDDGPSGSVNCRIYGWENGGYMLDGNAGLGVIPSLRINLSYTSNTTPNVGQAECWDISNTSIVEYFIPTATQAQWNSFKAAVLGGSFPGVTMAECPTCGDGVCSNAVTYWGFQESCGSNDSMLPAPETGDPMCTSDCGACPIVCGDGFCAVGTEHCTGGAGPGYNPCVECGVCSCGDSHFDCTGQCGTCGSCSPCCGDGTCDGTEDNVSCALDCAVPVCGDLICNGAENKCTCPGDCSTDSCGDGCCTGTETCGTLNSGAMCNTDCGACSCTGAVPINSTLCSGDSTGLTANTPNTSVANCTAGTKCEYLCDDYTKIVAGECRFCLEPPVQDACYDVAPACAAYPDCPASLSDGCQVDNQECRYNYTGDCSVNPCGDVYECNQCTFVCTGAAPANASLCPGDSSGLNRGDVPITLVASCTGSTKCEYQCDSGYYYSAGVCVPYVCTGAVPANSTLCAGDDTGLSANTPRTPVSACTVPTQCEYLCDPGYYSNGTACVLFQCTGPAPAHSNLCCVDYDLDTICEPDDTGLLADTPITLVDGCTQPTLCEYICRPYYVRNGLQCDPLYLCTGADPTNSTLCTGDADDLPANTPKTAVITGGCTVGTQCEYECDAGFVLDGNDCRAPMCTGTPDPNAVLCAGDNTGLTVDVPVTTVNTCGVPLCQYRCITTYHDAGVNQCDVNVCTGAPPANAALCAGDDTGITGRADLALTLVAACTATKCEYTCSPGFELNVAGTACVVETFDCLGTTASNSTICPGDDIGLLADTSKTTVAACTATMCEYTCNSGYKDGGLNQCDVNVCIGAVPSNATLCAGDSTGIPGNGDVSRTLVAACTATKCEYTCNSGFNFNGTICVANVCTGAAPSNATLCTGDDTSIPGNSDVARTLVPVCTAGTKCEYSCSNGYNYDTGVCDLNVCTGSVPPNATLCAGDDTAIPGNSDVVRTAVGMCTAPIYCQYLCDSGYHESGGVCDVNICTGAVPANATLCAGDDTSISGNSNISRTVANACTATKCEYTCDPGYIKDANICRPYMCTGTPDSNGTICPGDNAGLLADTPVTTVNACTATLCEYTCNDGYHDGGVNVCDVNVCTGSTPSNASLCSGDGTNIPGNSDVTRTLVAACTVGTKCEFICDDGYNFGGASCDVNICIGAIPINATICAGDDSNIPGNSDVNRTVVASCSAGTKCEYVCDDGFNFDGTGCTNLNQCIGAVPSNANICAGDDSNIPGNSDVTRTVVSACTAGTKCEYTCTDTYHDGGGICDPNICIGSIPANAAYCSGDDTNIPGGANMNRSLVITCGVPKCEYNCVSGYSVDAGVCAEDGEWIRIQQTVQPIPFAPACGGAFSGYPGYTINEGAPCPSAFLGDLYNCWKLGMDVLLQCHQSL